jgi:RNA polymerase sigma-70 factor, ECF subfamily
MAGRRATIQRGHVFKQAMIDEQSLPGGLAADLDGHFEQLVRAFQDRLYGFALRMTRSREEAEECAQDAFVRAYHALARYPSERRRELRLRPWLYQILLNVVRNRVRRPALVTVSVGADGPVVNGLAAPRHEQPEVVAMHAAGWRELESVLDALPARYKTAVVLRHVQGLSYAEAAEVLDQPVGTTKSDVHRGLRLLRDALAAEQVLEARNA